MIKWTIKLSEYDSSYHPRLAIKAQVLAKFLNESESINKDEGKWLLHVDGPLASIEAGVVIIIAKGDELEYAFMFDFKASNNKAEYEAFIVGIR
ncbi:UNVERIFIED_CONTAM: hypothetical protein Sradi_3649100 [Sesamum radiatum]|uniref:Reverse transcriptase domain-containing protein n=1 Tax=Sesamum radiatum TaxID=300843 RepID=A0AAW2QIK4_SESRA